MKVKVQDVAKKLVLWHTPTFRPLMSHDDLEPILYSVGFISLPPYAPPPSPPLNSPSEDYIPEDVQWKEYALPSSSSAAMAHSGVPLPRPRLPFPMIYGLHLIAYRAFLCALECYIDDVSSLFHVRAMPLTPLHDRSFEKAYLPMIDSDVNFGEIYLCRRGTIFHYMLEQIDAMERKAESNKRNEDSRIKGHRGHTDQIIMVPMDKVLDERRDILSS